MIKSTLFCLATMATLLCAMPSRAEDPRTQPAADGALVRQAVLTTLSASPLQPRRPRSGGIIRVQNLDGPACYKHKTQGVYQTFRPGDPMSPTIEWCWIHNGTCSCDGKTGDVCQEPGDNGQC